MSIRFKLLILLIVVALVPLAIVAAISAETMVSAGTRIATGVESVLVERGRAELEETVSHAADLMRAHGSMADLVLRRYRAVLARSFKTAPPADASQGGPALLATDIDRGETGNYKLTIDPRYQHPSGEKNPVTFDTCSFHLSAGLTLERAGDSIARVQRALPVVKELSSRSERSEHLVVRYFCGLENGLYAAYPGQGNLPDGFDPRERPWYRLTRAEDGIRDTPPYVDAASRRVVLSSVWPVHDATGRRIGVAGVDFDLESVLDTVNLPAEWGPRAEILVVALPRDGEKPELKVGLAADYVNADDLDLTEWGIGRRTLTAPDSGRAFEDLLEAMRTGSSGVSTLPWNGEPAWWGFAKLGSERFRLLLIVPEAVMTAQALDVARRVERLARDQVTLFGVAFALLAAVVLASALFASRRFTRPVADLAESVAMVARGNLETRVVPASRDEVGRLAGDFNVMVHQLQNHIAALRAETAARERVEAELRIGREIQASMLPALKPPFTDRPEFELAALNQPAAYVAGDFYDFFLLGDGRLAIVMADVAGKGVPAALFMSVAMTVLRNTASTGLPPGEVLTRANATLHGSKAERTVFVTVFLGYYDLASGELAYANAGHCAPRIVRAGGGVETGGGPTGTILGAFDGLTWETAGMRLEPGDRIVLYTDGVTEARTADRGRLGEEGLDAHLREATAPPLDPTGAELAEGISMLARAAEDDDVTVLILRRH